MPTPDHQFLIDLLILIALALGSALLFTRLRLSPIIGYLVSGIIAGPFGLHLIKNTQQVEVVAEFGVILLLFTIGLEFSVSQILRLKRLLLVGGLAQMLLCCAAIIGLATLLGLDVITAIPLAMALALSSTAIVLKLLSERGGKLTQPTDECRSVSCWRRTLRSFSFLSAFLFWPGRIRFFLS